MNYTKKILLAAASMHLLGCVSHSDQTASTHHHSNDTIHLENCAIQETIPGSKATGAFLTIHKSSDDSLSLVSAQIPSATKHVEIHEMIMKDGTMKMSQIQSYPLKKGNNAFQKGGYHIMLMGMKKQLTVGQQHDITMTFSDGSEKTCTAQVKSVESLTPKGMKMKHHH